MTLAPFPRPVINVVGSLTPRVDPTLHVVHEIGLPAELRAALDELSLDAPVPFADVARTGEPLFLQSENELSHYTDWGGR